MASESEKLHQIIEAACRVHVDTIQFRGSFNRGLERSLTTDAEEFSALVFAEVWSVLRKESGITSEGVFRAMERVKGRLRREVLKRGRTASLSVELEFPDKNANSVPEQVSQIEAREVVANAVLNFLHTLNPRDSLIFDECVISQASVEDFCSRTRISRATVYRHLSVLRKRFRLLLSRSLGNGGTKS